MPSRYRGSSQTREPEMAFMNCSIKVDTERSGWQRTVHRILRSIGVRTFDMNENGVVDISGIADPELLLKKLQKEGRRAQVCRLKYGQCSSNLFAPPNVTGGGHRMLPHHQQQRSSYAAPIIHEEGPGYITATRYYPHAHNGYNCGYAVTTDADYDAHEYVSTRPSPRENIPRCCTMM